MGQKTNNTVILLTCSLMILALIGCSNQSLTFQEGTHPGNAIYSEDFNAYTLENSLFHLTIEDQLFDKELGQALNAQILADLTALTDLFGVNQSVQIYVVEQTPTKETLSEGRVIYCAPEDVLEGDYREALVQAFTGFDQPWKLAGVYGYVFGEEVDQGKLVEYYSDVSNLDTLSLFPSFFIDAYTTRTNLAMAEDTATSFTKYLLLNVGADTLSDHIGQNDYRQEWLGFIGADVTYQANYDLSFLDDAQFTSSEDYALIITTDNRVYSFSDNIVEDPRAILEVLAFYYQGWENLIAIFETNAPEHFAEIEAIWDGPLNLYFDGDLSRTYYDEDEHSIYFPSTGVQSFMTATFYFLFPKQSGENQIWKKTGLGDYIVAISDIPDRSYYAYFMRLPEELTGDDAEFLSDVQAYYLSQAPFPEELTDFNFGLLYEAIAMVAFQKPSLNVEFPRLAEYSVAQWTNQENHYLSYAGNSLTYPQAYLFTKYLVETYGLDAMLNYYNKSTTSAFESSFGLTYYEAFADFRSAYDLSR